MQHQIRSKLGPVRSVVIAVAMLAVLVGSLTLAYALVVTRHEPWEAGTNPDIEVKDIDVGDLRLKIPEVFELMGSFDPVGGLDNLAVFNDRLVPQRQLQVAEVSGYKPRAPVDALKHMLELLLSRGVQEKIQQWQRVTPFRIGTMTGAWYVGLEKTSLGAKLHLVGVITEDARRYWVVYLNHLVTEASFVVDAVDADRRLLGFVFYNAVNRFTRDAQASDCRAVGLGEAIFKDGSADSLGWVPPGWHVRVVGGQSGEEPLVLIPQDPQPQLRLLRIRGVIDAGGWDRSHPLSPAALLWTQFEDWAGRPPRGREFWMGQIDGVQACRVEFAGADGSLVRQVWYASEGGGRGVLIEVVSEPRSLAWTSKWVGPLIGRIRDALVLSPESTPGLTLGESAVLRGRDLVQWQRAELPDRLVPGWDYFLVEEGSQLVGYQVDRIMHTVENDPLPIRGFSKTIRRHRTQPHQVAQQWRLSADGLRFWWNQHWAVYDSSGARRLLGVVKVQLQDHRLSMKRQGQGMKDAGWSVKTPSSLVLPMTQEVWPLADHELWKAGEALVWMTNRQQKPRPYWVRLAESSLASPRDDPQEADQATYRVRLRPMMSLDADRLTFDSRGKLLEYRSKRVTGPGDGVGFVAHRVNRYELVNTFPSIKTRLDEWEQEDSTP